MTPADAPDGARLRPPDDPATDLVGLGPGPEDELDLRVTHVRGHAVVIARGEIDLATVGAFRGMLNELMVQGHVDVVVDLTAVPFVDSSALGALVAAHRRARGLGGSLSVAGVQQAVARILELTGLDRVLAAYPTANDAVKG